MQRSHVMRVLMVTGVYYPDKNGASLQCMRIISELKDKVLFSVLTASKYSNLLDVDVVDGTRVNRIILKNGVIFRLQFLVNLLVFLIKNCRKFDIIHLHGFSLRSIVIVFISKLMQKKVVIKMTSFGHDDPLSIRDRSRIQYFFYSMADAYIGVSPAFSDVFLKSELNKNKFFQVPNGVDTELFKPVSNKHENVKIRKLLGLPVNMKVILFVGHFSNDKRPDDLLSAWLKTSLSSSLDTSIVFIGRMDTDSFEIEMQVISKILKKSQEFLGKNIFFVEETDRMADYYRASDVFVLPSIREGLPNSLLEAMSSGLTVIATRLQGITDWIINDGVNGYLYEPGDVERLSQLLLLTLYDDTRRAEIELNARDVIHNNFDISKSSEDIYNIYQNLF